MSDVPWHTLLELTMLKHGTPPATKTVVVPPIEGNPGPVLSWLVLHVRSSLENFWSWSMRKAPTVVKIGTQGRRLAD